MTDLDISTQLRSHGVTPTQQRVEIARLLFARPQHLSADQILDSLNETGQKASKATVYNTLGLFARKGLVKEVIVDPSKVFYDSNVTDHQHFYNVDTGKLVDIAANHVALQQLPELPEGTQADGVDIIIRIRNAS